MKRILLILITIIHIGLQPICPQPMPGQRLWNIAAAALTTMDGIESNLEALITIVHNDFVGTFSVTAALAENLTIAQNLTNDIISVTDHLNVIMQDNLSLTNIIESDLTFIQTSVDTVDMSGIFTALETLSQDILIALGQVATELQDIEAIVIDLTQSEIDHNITINSQLTVLQTDVDLLNSALDNFSIIETIAVGSSLDVLSSLINALETNVDSLQSELSTGFAGTFTALEAQNGTATTVQSFAENILNESATNFDNLLSSLELLHDSVITIDSLVDQLSNIVANVATIESLVDHALTEVTNAAQTVASLPDQVETIISTLESIHQTEIDLVLSDIDSTITLVSVLNNKADTIISKISEIDLADTISTLEVISNELIIAESQLDTINFATSTLANINSELDILNGTALTIESIIDALDQELQNIFNTLSISHVALLASEIDQITIEVADINSDLDLINNNLAITTNALDLSILLSASTLAQLFTMESTINGIESEIDTITFDMHALNSTLSVIENQSFTISSKLDVATSLIDTLNDTASELIQDFEQTWTVIQAIDNSLSTIESLLELPHTFQASVDLSGVYTTINAIIARETTVNTQVDTYASLVNALSTAITVDFNGIFTALATVEPISTSLIDKINSEVNISLSYLGTPIYASMLGTTGYTITSPGRYYLAEDITFTPTATFNGAIFIDGINNVTIDLNQKILQQASSSSAAGSGILVNNASNTRIMNGIVDNFTTNQLCNSSCTNSIIRDISVPRRRTTAAAMLINISWRNIVIDNCTIVNSTVIPGGGLVLQGPLISSLGSNVRIANCYINKFNSGLYEFAGDNSCIKNIITENCGYVGMLIHLNKNHVIQQCIALNNSIGSVPSESGGIVLHNNNSSSSARNGTIKNSITSNNQKGIVVDAFSNTPAVQQCCVIYNSTLNNSSIGIAVNRQTGANSINRNAILFNNTLNNGINIAEINSAGPNTFLGNFAFNSTAVGNPNNTNYSMASSIITGKFATCSQRGSFGSMPAEWININMLP